MPRERGGRRENPSEEVTGSTLFLPQNHQPEPKPPTDNTNQFVGERTPHSFHHTATPRINPKIRTPGAQLHNPPLPPQPLLLTNYPPIRVKTTPTKTTGLQTRNTKTPPPALLKLLTTSTNFHPRNPKTYPQPPNLASIDKTPASQRGNRGMGDDDAPAYQLLLPHQSPVFFCSNPPFLSLPPKPSPALPCLPCLALAAAAAAVAKELQREEARSWAGCNTRPAAGEWIQSTTAASPHVASSSGLPPPRPE